MLKKVSLFVVFAFLFLLTACEPVSPANNTIKSNDIKIIKSQEKIEAQTFQLELWDIVSQKTEKNKITDFILRNYTLSPSGTMYSHCKLNKCESKNVFEDNEKNQKLLTSLSGDEYTFRSIWLFAKDETDKLIVDLVDADFEIFSEHTSSLDGDTLTIHDLSKHLPLVVYFPKEHYIQRDFKFYKNTLLFVNQIDPAPFFDKYTVQSKFDNIDFKKINMPIQTKEGFYTQFSAIGQYDSEATVILHGIGKNKPEMTFENPKKGKVWHKWEKGNLVISLSDMQLWEANSFHMSYILDEQKYDYSMTLYPISELKIISSEQVKIKWELSNEYKICFSKYIDEAIFRNKLNQTMWTWVFQLSYHYYPAYGYGWEQYTPGIACYQLFAYVDPQSDHEFNLKDIEDDYGQKISFNINIKQHKLPASQTYLKIVGKPVNVLPKNGERWNKFQVIGKNKEEATLYFRECNWLKDYPEQIVNNLKNKDLNSSTLTHQFLACWETQSHKIIFDEGRYWKERVQEVEINKLFSGHYPDIVEIGVNNFEKQRGKLFIRTNIGILSKYTPNELHVWTHQFRDGKKRPGWMYMVWYYDHSQKKFITREWSISNYFSYNFPKDFDLGFLYVYDDYDASFITTPKSDVSIPSSINNGYDWYYNNFAISPWSVWWNATWEKINPYRLYFFTDRVLYKPGVKSDIFISGWIRKPWNSTIPRGHLSLDLHNSEGTVVASKSIDKFDDFWWFDVSFELAEDAPLGAYYIQWRFEQGGFDDLYYLSYFQVQEFKKPNIDIKTETIFDQKDTLLKISPQYYFGQELQKYDINLIYSLKPQNYWIRDWDRCGKDWCDEPMFYNNVEQHARSSGGMLNIKDYEAKYFNLNLAIPSYSLADFVIDITLSDAQTKEIVHKTIQEKFMPQYLVGIQWRKHHRHNSNNGQYELKWEVLWRISNNKDTLDNYKSNANGSVEIKTYYRSFNNNQSQWPDGEWYYSNGWEYELIDTTSSNLNWWKFKKNLDLETAGKYFIRVIYENNYETHQYVRVYNSSYQYDFYGDMSNNYELNVFANNKEYEVGEEVEINIEPQIKWATAIITVEKEWKMMLQKEQILNGSPIVLNARKERFPNAYISVTQIVWEELNKTVNKRAEPRFYIGYTNIALSPSMMGIDFDISISDTGGNNKDYYSPGETIKLKIKAKDNKWNPLKTRVSVWIIDKSLMDLYDKIRTPLKNFYTRSYPGFFIVSNYQLLYKALNVITADGEKWWGGGWEWWLTPITPRKNFLDIAYWNGAQITDKNGISNFEFVVPDNLTTWVVDVIWVGKRWEMDTKREYLTVSKDIIFNAYLPRFVSPYSVVRIPLSIISNNPDVQNPKIIGNISVGNFENQINIEKNEMGESYFDLDLDKVPLEQIIKHDKIKIFLQAWTYDAVEYDLPIRKESMYLHAFESFDQKSVDEHIKLANKASHVNVKISVSSMPVGQLSEAIRYLLRYPYWCTEQLLSSIYPSLLAKDLSDKGIIEQWIISWDKINYRWEWNDMSNVVASTLNKLYKNQTPSWLMWYWPNTEEWDKWLSIYAYHVIMSISISWCKNLALDKRLVHNLWKNYLPKTLV